MNLSIMEFAENVYFSVQCTLYTFIGVATLLPILTKGRKIYFFYIELPNCICQIYVGATWPQGSCQSNVFSKFENLSRNKEIRKIFLRLVGCRMYEEQEGKAMHTVKIRGAKPPKNLWNMYCVSINEKENP